MVSKVLKLTDEQFAVVAMTFCRDMPIPQHEEEIKGETVLVDSYTELEWIMKYMIGQMMKKCLKGFGKLTLDGNPMDIKLVQSILDALK